MLWSVPETSDAVPLPPSSFRRVRMLEDFDAEEKGELSMRTGETAAVMAKQPPLGWLYVRTDDGMRGLVPEDVSASMRWQAWRVW